jgi:tetratricopeptide (TPR) repeat protein
MYRFTRSGIAAARAHFRRAVALDPEFAPAHARLAYAEIQDYWYGTRGGREQALMHAQEDAARAIALDPKNALGHFALGRVHALHHDFDAAMPAFETAIRLNPSLAQARFALGQAHLYAGRAREAVRLLDTAIELDPHDPHRWAFLHDQSDGYYALGDLNEAAQRARAASRFPNATHWPLATLASVLGSAGKLEEAREALFELRAKLPDYTFSFAETEFEHVMDKSFVQRFLQGLQAAGL